MNTDMEKFENNIKQSMLIDQNQTLSGLAFLKMVDELTEQLSQHQISDSHRVVLYGRYTIKWVAIYYALLKLKAVIIPFDAEIEEEPLREKLAFSEPHFFITINEARIIPGYLKRTIFLQDCSLFIAKDNPKLNQEKNTATMIFSSGTGGKEKLIMLSRYSLDAVINFYKESLSQYHCQSILNLLPLSAIYPLSVVLATLAMGKKIVLASATDDLTAILKNEKIDCLPAVPLLIEKFNHSIKQSVEKKPFYLRFLFKIVYLTNQVSQTLLKKNIGRQLFSAVHKMLGPELKILLSGGATLNIDTLKFLNNLGFNILEGYGLTELGGVATLRENNPVFFGSAGKPLHDIKIKISPSDNEILISSPRLFSGYYKDPRTTTNAFADQWFKTGDIGHFNSEGALVILGRLKDIIVRDDEKKYLPSLLENHFKQIKELGEFAICGINLPNYSGDKVVMFILRQEPQKLDRIISRVHELSQKSQREYQIDQCIAVDNFPKNKLGKICRQTLILHYYERGK